MLSSLLIFIVVVKSYAKALEERNTMNNYSTIPASELCIFNWDRLRFPEKIEYWLSSFSQECMRIHKRNIVIKHRPNLKKMVIKDRTWGLGRIFSKDRWVPYELKATSSVFTFSKPKPKNSEYFSTENDQLEIEVDLKAGLGVDVYILDTGINVFHEEFGGRARFGKNFVAKESDEDFNGHGTHVAGIIGSETFGVAKESRLISVKILNRNKQGELASVLSAIDWVISSVKKSGFPSIIHLSAIISPDERIDQAVERAARFGIPVIVAGGNDISDACKFSPGRTRYAITVSGINPKDQRPGNMPSGKCVDLYAPGIDILSTYIGSNSSIAYMSGTSMAAPYVTGIAAAILSRGFDLGDCHRSELSEIEKEYTCASRLYEYLIKSSDDASGLRIARVPDIDLNIAS